MCEARIQPTCLSTVKSSLLKFIVCFRKWSAVMYSLCIESGVKHTKTLLKSQWTLQTGGPVISLIIQDFVCHYSVHSAWMLDLSWIQRSMTVTILSNLSCSHCTWCTYISKASLVDSHVNDKKAMFTPLFMALGPNLVFSDILCTDNSLERTLHGLQF